ncbi:MAG: hypothetical protein K0S18_1690 [Anaerocolumna sp.]|jgi:branched-chain amino acid transport system substrate-binding protein|nr:hypothetical protein [Anaerocolumna sp.]
MIKKCLKTRITSFALATGLILTSLTGCSSSSSANQDDSDVYKFAMMAPLTGDAAQYGLTYKNTLEILVNKVNSDGGINGKQIQVDYYDDKKDTKEALNIANKIVADGNYIGVVGSQTSSCSMAAAPVLQESKILMISPQASNPNFTLSGDYIFSLQLSSSYEADLTAKLVVENNSFKKIAVIYSNDDWGVGVNDEFTSYVESLGGEIVANETFISGQTKDFSPLISKMKEAQPDAIFIAALYSEGAQILQQCKNLDFNVPVFTTNTLYKQEFLELASDNADGILMLNSFELDNQNDNYLYLANEYLEKTGKQVDTYVTQSYDALKLMLDALENVGDDTSAMKDYIASVNNYEGVSGTFSFNENRVPIKPEYVFTIENGEYVQIPDLVIVQ